MLKHPPHDKETPIMTIDDFTKKNWIVLPPGSEKCKEGDLVTIKQENGEVTIECAGTIPYGKARYDATRNRIVADGYDVRLQIVFTPNDLGPVGGSWTAEDNTGGVDGE
jgi:hypothetical protein